MLEELMISGGTVTVGAIWQFAFQRSQAHHGEINFIVDQNTRPLHISIRGEAVIINAMVGGSWGEELVIDAGSTIADGILEVRCLEDGFQLCVDGTAPILFAHRASIQKIDVIWWSPSVRLLKPSKISRQSVQLSPAKTWNSDDSASSMFMVHVRAFGHEVDLLMPPSDVMAEAAISRLKKVYEPYIASQGIDSSAVIIDIGAGFGSFTIPLAKALPAAKFYCFEPLPKLFSVLQENILANNLTNVVAVNAAVLADTQLQKPAAGDALLSADASRQDIEALAQPAQFAICPSGDHIVERPKHNGRRTGPPAKLVKLPAIDASLLKSLAPTFVKISAPGWEEDILESLGALPLSHVLAEVSEPVSSPTVIRENIASCLIKMAGQPHGLRRNGGFHSQWSPGLDVVVPSYNAEKYIVECVEGIVALGRPDIRVLIIDDGSTDHTQQFALRHFKKNGNVSVITKPNGGCASARNYGRRISKAEHIAFVDADDVVDPDLFPKLLELARYTGAEVVQGGFDFFECGDSGPNYKASYEGEMYATWDRVHLGKKMSFISVPSDNLIGGQPTIWRRVYRRDFLDNKNVFFPEHIRAFDDLYFHTLTLHYAQSIPMLDGPKYHYRQHPAQDIKQGDERHFYELEMYLIILKRALTEGWNNFDPILSSFISTVNWSVGGLREDLVGPFLKGAADLWVIFESCLGAELFAKWGEGSVNHPDFSHHLREVRARHNGFNRTYAWAYIDNLLFHPSLLRAARNAKLLAM